MSPVTKSRPTRVVIVEDDPWVARVNRDMVEREPGFVVVGLAETLREGLDLALSLSPDLLLVDNYLPDGSGLELLQSLRGQDQPCEIIMITAANDVASVQRALHGGVIDYLIKPFQQSRLQEALERFTARETLGQKERNFTQNKLDRLLGHRSDPRLPKGIDLATLEKIRQSLVAASEPLSAEEVGAQVGVSRVTAWRYLEYLLSADFLTCEMVYGSVGRPVKLYKKGFE